MNRTSLILIILVALVLFVLAGPRGTTDLSWTDVQIGEDVDAWLAEQEAAFDDIRPGVEKQVIWADSSQQKTPYSLVYLHGFSASNLEARPVPDSIAAQLGMNLYFPRITGHGRDSDAMSSATDEDWWQSSVEALRVGEAIGDRVVLMGLSTGATLAAALEFDPVLAKRIAAHIWISPNLEIHDPRSDMLLWPWGNVLLSLVQGDTYSWEAQNERHAAIGTREYASRVLIDVVSLAEEIQARDFSQIETPVFMAYSPTDTVIDQAVSVAKYGDLANPANDSMRVLRSLDRNDHVIVGDALGPDNSEEAIRRMVAWLNDVLPAAGMD